MKKSLELRAIERELKEKKQKSAKKKFRLETNKRKAKLYAKPKIPRRTKRYEAECDDWGLTPFEL